MYQINAEIEQLLENILDVAYRSENADHGNEMVIATISKLAIMSLFYQAMHQMKNGIDKSFKSMEMRAWNSHATESINYDKILHNILKEKRDS
jgi:hypothetical protein